jgi:hypothetical protein
MTAAGEQAQQRVTAWARHQEHAYAPDDDRPLGSMLAIMAGYGAVTAGLFAAVRASGKELPERLSAADLGLLTVATHKIARLAAKDPLTSPLRAPFTRFAGTSGEAELAEEVRGSGPRKAVGELVTCPFCLGQWAATGLAFGLVLAPRPTRLVASVFTAVTGADLLQLVYAKTQEWATG